MSFAASVGFVIICVLMQCQADLKVGDVLNKDMCCRLLYGRRRECTNDFQPICAKIDDYNYYPADNMCKLCAEKGNTKLTVAEIGDNLRPAWPASCKQAAVGGYDQVYNSGSKDDQ